MCKNYSIWWARGCLDQYITFENSTYVLAKLLDAPGNDEMEAEASCNYQHCNIKIIVYIHSLILDIWLKQILIDLIKWYYLSHFYSFYSEIIKQD